MLSSDSSFSLVNGVVMAAVLGAGYLIVNGSWQSVAPPDDAWFQAEVVNRAEPVLVKFGAVWCPPCRMLDPELDRLSSEMGGRIAVVRINVDQRPALAQHYHVSSIPRLLLFKQGKVIADRVGYADHQRLASWVDGYSGR